MMLQTKKPCTNPFCKKGKITSIVRNNDLLGKNDEEDCGICNGTGFIEDFVDTTKDNSDVTDTLNPYSGNSLGSPTLKI